MSQPGMPREQILHSAHQFADALCELWGNDQELTTAIRLIEAAWSTTDPQRFAEELAWAGDVLQALGCLQRAGETRLAQMVERHLRSQIIAGHLRPPGPDDQRA